MKPRFLLLVLTLVIAGCEQEKDIKIIPPYDGPLAVVHNVETLFSDSAKVRIKLTAPVQHELINNDREFSEGFNLAFLDKNGEVETTLTAEYGIFYSEKAIYMAKGNVVIKNIKTEEQLDSEELYWNPAKERIYTDKFVRVQTKDEILMGNGLEATQDFSEYTILKPTGIFSIEE